MSGARNLLLGTPVADAVAALARRQAAAAELALRRFERDGGREDLHQFRIAIRRLRALLRAYKPRIGRAGGRKIRRRLRELTLATNALRDVDVQIAWSVEARAQLPSETRAELDALLRRLRARRREARGRAATIGTRFRRTARSLRKRIRSPGKAARVSFRSAFCEAAGRELNGLQRAMAAAATDQAAKRIHAVRQRIRRLRYLVEPLRRALPEAKAATRQLKRLQHLYGRVHDLQVLERDLGSALREMKPRRAGGAEPLTAMVARQRTELLADVRSRGSWNEDPAMMALAALLTAAGCRRVRRRNHPP
jgi:CHAD domain-containing protein